jgi:hypothetical protein
MTVREDADNTIFFSPLAPDMSGISGRPELAAGMSSEGGSSNPAQDPESVLAFRIGKVSPSSEPAESTPQVVSNRIRTLTNQGTQYLSSPDSEKSPFETE